MNVALISCNGYKIIRRVTVRDYSELPALCRVEEELANDGYAVYASDNGVQVAYSDGVVEPDCGFDPIYQAGYAYACGYHD